VNDDEIARLADDLTAAFRAAKPSAQAELDAQLDAFQAAFHAIQKARDTQAAIAWCAPAVDVLFDSARAKGFTLPDWFVEIVSIVELHATREKIKSATESMRKALEELAKTQPLRDESK
jgi:hypothetical protein